MQKSKFLMICLILLIAILSIGILAACDKDTEDPNKKYTIQFTVNGEINQIEVKDGDLYSTNIIPQKYGYIFAGYFDAQSGGTKYIDNQGSALSAFNDKKNLVLFPQFVAKEYTLILDYQGAEVTGGRSINVCYDGDVKNLPLNLYVENKDFMGWYTEPNREGIQVADAYGVLPQAEKFNNEFYDIPTNGNKITLYAGFRGTLKTLTLYFNDYNAPEEIIVEYGTNINDIKSTTRIDGKGVLNWTKTNGSTEVFVGKVTTDMVLYALEYAPVLDFNVDGGKEVSSIIAKSGASITLPVSTKKNYSFGGWKTESGSPANFSTMPNESMTLVAIWNPIIFLNERGGTDVADICQSAGTKITLPKTNKNGYVFAGWYFENGDEFIESSMPSESITLIAKYYKIATMKKVLCESNTHVSCAIKIEEDKRYIIDLKEIYNGKPINVKFSGHLVAYHGADNKECYFQFYNDATVSSSNLIKKFIFNVGQVKKEFDYEFDFELNTTEIYLYYGTNFYEYGLNQKLCSISDVYINIEYVDTTEIY